jgi:hypothetical protein
MRNVSFTLLLAFVVLSCSNEKKDTKDSALPNIIFEDDHPAEFPFS